MPFDFTLLADNDAINEWLGKNPLVLGLIALAIGGALAGWGGWELSQGVAYDKWGNKMEGGMGQMLAIVRIVFGVAACAFGLYKIFAG
jgi:hypothetical protein